MKKYDLFKVLIITLLVVTLLSWIIPAGAYVNGSFTSLEQNAPIGLYDLFRLPFITPVTFIQFGILFLAIGGFYGVLIDISDDTVIVEFGNNKNCRVPMQKAAIAQVEKVGE